MCRTVTPPLSAIGVWLKNFWLAGSKPTSRLGWGPVSTTQSRSRSSTAIAYGSALPYAMAVDDRDRLWVVETGPQPNRLVGFDPASQKFFSQTPIAESGGVTVRHMVYHAG